MREQVKHMGVGVMEPELVASTGFFAWVKWKKSFFPNLMRRRVANEAQRGSPCVYFCKSAQMQYNKFQLETVRSAWGREVCIVVSYSELSRDRRWSHLPFS